MAQRIQLRRDTAANWTSANPTLASGEVGYETDTNQFKIGDGVTAWSDIADYFAIGGGGGGGSGTVSTGTANRLAYYPSTGTTVDDLSAITASRALVSNASGLPTASSVTSTVLAFLDATSSVQTQLDAKVPTTRTVNSLALSSNIVLDPDDLDDTSTTNKFTTASDISKLAGIEALADVTDATNVDAAGAVMNSDTSTVSMSFVIDEDDMVSDSATKVPTQQSVKAYVDANAGGVTDHGALTGLSDDDHTQYILVDGSRAFTGKVSYNAHPTFSSDTELVDKKYVDDSITGSGGYTDEQAQDAVGNILVDSSEIDFTYSDATPSITATLITGSIDVLKLDAGVQASLALADTSIQPGDSISDLTNTTELVQDIVGAMTTGNTETLITVTYQDADGTIDFVVNSDLHAYSWSNVDATDLKVGSVTQAYSATANNRNLIIGIGNETDVITTGTKYVDVVSPFTGTITGWTIYAPKETGSIVVDVWKDTYANYPPTDADSIAGSELPTLSSANKNQDLSLSTWTTSVAAGDVFRVNVDSATTVTKVIVVLHMTVA